MPLPITDNLDPRKVALGSRLFIDDRLSGSGSSNCTTCHSFTHGGAEGRAFSTGADGKPLDVNTTSIFDNEFNYLRDWQGYVESLRTLIGDVITDRRLMAADWMTVIQRLQGDQRFAADFGRAYADGITEANLLDALSLYVRSLATPNARFDRYLRGENNAMTAEEIEGFNLFRSYGCISCHQGQNIGGNIRQVFGVVGEPGDYFRRRGVVRDADLGRFNVTHDTVDRFVFRVPSLRNVMLTTPYLHDGSASTIEEAVSVMFRYQLGLEPPAHDLSLIVKFLNTLTGEQPQARPADDQKH